MSESSASASLHAIELLKSSHVVTDSGAMALPQTRQIKEVISASQTPGGGSCVGEGSTPHLGKVGGAELDQRGR